MRAPTLRLLGAPRVVVAGGEQVLTPDRPLQLLVYLAVRGDWVTRDTLAELLFPDRSTEAARSNVRTVLHRARRFDWAAALESSGELVCWRIESDVAAFEAALTEDRAAEAIDLYGGALGLGLDDPDNPHFTDWLVFERRRLAARWRGAALAALERLEPQPALALAERLLAADPLDDDALRGKLAALVSLARGAEARQVYAAFAALLAEELGVEPSVATRNLAAALGKSQPAPTAPPAPETAPFAASGGSSMLVGRVTELRELQSMLARDECRVLTITGPGGVGKSRLAREALRVVAPQMPDGAWWVAIDDLTEVEQLAPRVAAVIGLDLGGRFDPLDELVARLRNARALLVLDNSEHLAGIGAPVQRLIDACSGLKLLNTSRARLGVTGEWLMPLAGLPVPDAGETDVDVLRVFDAVRLFELRAATATPAFDAQRDAPEVAALVRAVEGWPLAIELAAAWVRLLPVADIRGDLEGSLDLLARSQPKSADRQHSVRASFAHSWNLLAPAERGALSALTVLRGSFSRQAALQVADASLPLLAALVDESLVHADGSGRFALHPLIQRCAAEKLADAEARLRRHAEHYGQLLARYADFGGVSQAEALTEMGLELENCRAAWNWAVRERDAAWIERSALALMHFFEMKGRWREGIELLGSVLGEFSERDPAQRRAVAVVLRARATLQYRRGDLADAVLTARRGLKLNQVLRQRAGIKACLNVIGLSLWRRDHLAEAIRFFEHALKLAVQDQDQRGVAKFTNGIAVCEKTQGHYVPALERYQQALTIYRALGDLQGVANTLNNMGNVHRAMEQWQPALKCFEEGLAVCDAQGFAASRPFHLINIALTCFELRDLDRSHRLSTMARAEARTCGERYIEIAAIENLARIAVARDDLRAAADHLRAAIGMARTDEDPELLISALNVSAEWLLARGDWADAVRLWRLVAGQAQVEEAERAHALKMLAQHGASGSEAGAGDEPSTGSFAEFAEEVLARLDSVSATAAIPAAIEKR